MKSRLTGKREKWTDSDMEELKQAYVSYPLKFSESLLERHGKAGCFSKGQEMGLCHKLIASPFQFATWNETTKAYLAGIVDGEGTITICNVKWKRNSSSGIAKRPVVTIANTNYLLLDYLKSLNIGGTSHDKRKTKEHHKQAFQWYLSAQLPILGFLKAILPYLVIKKEKAIEIIEFITMRHPKEILNA